MKIRMKRSEVRHYKKMVIRLTLSLITTTVIIVSALSLITLILKRLGFNAVSKASSVIVLILFYLICAAIASCISYFAMWNIFRPLKDLSSASKKIANGDYSIRLKYDGRLEELANAFDNFNYMAQELDSVEMMRNDFVANVSHEFKTPLSALGGYLTLLQDDSLTSEERDEFITRSFFSIEKLNDLTDNILRISKLEHQSALDEPDTFRLDEQLREAVVMMEPKWSRKNISFDIELPEITYTGQRSMLFQVWTNLISNAIKFSDEGGIVTLRLEQSEHHVKVYVGDEGAGMTEEEQRHIFEKFYQADTSRQSQGNGLGLAICKEIVSKCSGKIYVTSSPGNGSVFLVSLRK